MCVCVHWSRTVSVGIFPTIVIVCVHWSRTVSVGIFPTIVMTCNAVLLQVSTYLPTTTPTLLFYSNLKTELPIKLKSKIDQFWFFDFFWTKFFFLTFFLVFFYYISDLATAVAAIWAIFRNLFFHNMKGKAWSFVLRDHIEKMIII